MRAGKTGAVGPKSFPDEIAKEEELFRELIAQRLILDQIDLPMMPHVLDKIMHLTRSPEFSLRNMTDIILTDQVICTQILREVNANRKDDEEEIISVHHAIMKLGPQNLKDQVISKAFSATLIKDTLYGTEGPKLWDHAVGCAFAAKELAEYLRQDPDEAFMIGLIHDIGKMVYIGVTQEILKEFYDQFTNLGVLMDEIMDEYHSNLGGLLAEKWFLPKKIQDCIRHHHSYEQCHNYKQLVMIVNLADKMCNFAGFGMRYPTDDPTGDRVVQFLGVNPNKIFEIIELIPETIQKVRSLFRAST